MRIGKGRLQRHRDEMGEDVNPSAYIVNLADCMLVLACGFMVAMMAKWNINPQVEQLDQSSMEEITPSVAPEDITSAGSGYIEAGKVYIDPQTGEYYMIKKDESAEGASGTAAAGAETAEGAQTEGGGAEGEGAEAGSDGSGSSGSGRSASAPGLFGM